MKFRISLKWKIFTGSIALAMAIVGLNLLAAGRLVEQAAARHGELDGVYRRYETYQRNISDGYAAAIDAWALSSQRLRETLARGDDDAARPQIEQLQSTLKDDLKADFLVVIDKHGDPFISPDAPLTNSDVRSMRNFADLRHTAKIRDKLLTHEGVTYVINGVPILDGNTNVGSITIATRLDRIYRQFKAQSDSDPNKQVDLALVANTGRCTAASLRPDLWDDLERAVQKSPHETDREGPDLVEVLRFDNALHDFHMAVENGYDSGLPGTVGSFYVLKNRADHAARMAALIRDNLIIGIIAVAFAVVASFVMAALITRPIKRLITATEEIAHGHGDLTRRIDPSLCGFRDEIGDLARNLNAMLENLHQLASGVQHASLHVGSSSAEISAASKQMLTGAKEQALKIESSTAAVTELSSSIQQVADNALQATKAAKESGDQVQTAIDGMARIRATVDDAAEKIGAMAESGKRIGNIVEVIRQISEQTTLLALNASIEAAHAGEQGRGFAVVANEVSSLAKRVGQSAKDIEDLIGTIKDQTAEAVSSMQTGTSEVVSGTETVNRTLGSLKRIVEVIQDTANAVQEQAVVSDEIARNMDAVQKIAAEVLASSEEAVVQGETLHELAHGLEESVRGFRIEGGRANGSSEIPPGPGAAKGALLPPDRRKTARG